MVRMDLATNMLLWMVMSVISLECLVESMTRMNTELGTLVTHVTRINVAPTKINLIFKLDTLPELNETIYQSPCDYENLTTKVMRVMRYEKVLPDLHAIRSFKSDYKRACTTFNEIRSAILGIKTTLDSITSHEQNALKLLRARSRKTRSIGNFIRRTLGIANLRKQNQLKRKIDSIDGKLFTTDGELRKLNFFMEINNHRLDSLFNSSKTFYNLLEQLSNNTYGLHKNIVVSEIIEKHRLVWMADAMLGIVSNQLQLSQLHMIRKRVTALNLLAGHKLSTDLIAPDVLFTAISKLEVKLRKYPMLKITNKNVMDYYGDSRAIGYIDSNDIYINIPIAVNVINQIFDVHQIDTFLIPIDNDPSKATLIMPTNNLIAINQQHSLYFIVKESYLQRCTGKGLKMCTGTGTTQYSMDRMLCETAILINDLKAVSELCNIGFVNVTNVMRIQFFDIGNGTILVSNPHRERVYMECSNKLGRQEMTQEELATISVGCLCWLTAALETARSPMVSRDNCFNDIRTEVHVVAHKNILYASEMLNVSIDKLTSILNETLLNSLPKITIPTYTERLRIPMHEYGHIFDLKKIARNRPTYQSILDSTISNNSEKLEKMFNVKIISYVVSSIVFVVILVVIFLTCKTKSIIRLLAVSKLIREGTALPIHSPPANIITPQWAVISWELISIIILILAFTYWVIKHMNLIKTCTKYLSFPCAEFNLQDKRPQLHIFLYFASLSNYCYIKVDTIFAPPHKITVLQSETDINITLHNGFWGSYLTIIHKNLGIKTGNCKWDINNTVAVPMYTTNILKKVMSEQYEVQLVYGNDYIYRGTNVNLKV